MKATHCHYELCGKKLSPFRGGGQKFCNYGCQHNQRKIREARRMTLKQSAGEKEIHG